MKESKRPEDVFLPSVRMLAEDAAALHRRAAAEGYELTTWIRRTLFRAAGIPLTRAVRPMGRPKTWRQTTKGSR